MVTLEWPFVLGVSHVFSLELFDIVNIGKRDAGGVWRRADPVTDRTSVMTYVTTFLFMKLRSLGRFALADTIRHS